MSNEEVNETVETEQPKKKKGCLRYVLYLFVGLFVLGLIGSIFDDGKDSGGSSSSASWTSVEEMFTPYAQKEDLSKDDVKKIMNMLDDLNIKPSMVKKVKSDGSINILAPKGCVQVVYPFFVNMKRGDKPSLHYSRVSVYSLGKEEYKIKKVFLTEDDYDDIKDKLNKKLKDAYKKYKNVKISGYKVYPGAAEDLYPDVDKSYVQYYIEATVEYTKDVVGKADEVKTSEVRYRWNNIQQVLERK